MVDAEVRFVSAVGEPSGRPVGWGIAGCGWVVRDFVAPALGEARNARALALLDPSADSLRAVGETLPEARPHTDLATFLHAPGLEAVYIATPNHLHLPLVRVCAEAGKHVLCEKPMAPTLDEAREMVAACRRAGVVYATAFDQRFHAAHAKLRELVRSGALGTVTAVRIRYACWLPPDWSPDGGTGERRENWRIDPARAGGGAFMDLAPHGLDLAQSLLGERLVEVRALFQRRVFDYPVEDGAVLIGRFAGGALLEQHVAYNTPESFPRRELEVVGTRAMAVATDTMGQTPGGRLEVISAASGERRALDVPGSERSPFLNGIEAFSEHLRGGRSFPYTPEDDLHTMELVELANRQGETEPEVRRVSEKRYIGTGSSGESRLRETPHGSRIPDEWPGEADLGAYLCANCGFWQKRFREPDRCPVCEDSRHVLPERGYEFLAPEVMDRRVECVWEEVEEGVWRFSVAPAVGISPSGYLVATPEGNVAFEGCPFYSEAALRHIESLGGVDFVSASHPHTYGALWQLVERFRPEVALHRDDLGWATAFGVTWPFDKSLDLPGGLRLLHTGGHFPGHAVMHDPGRRTLFIGDAVKLELAASDPTGRTSDGISAHKAFVRRVPLTKGELRRYREVFAPLEFTQTFTPFEQCRNVGREEVLKLLDVQLEGRPFVGVLPL